MLEQMALCLRFYDKINYEFEKSSYGLLNVNRPLENLLSKLFKKILEQNGLMSIKCVAKAMTGLPIWPENTEVYRIKEVVP